ncbi:uncharacterized protein LOC111693746 [Trichogramma pretiosum]|uniref:uncharacterized protein LOC111693746 n=1 Tax=Trichogramma pretiosum TaxID=7493 RepID=UPI000C718D47|nr:uncharacterized protein LOC111693746 [Trichogramma pretiosum]
MLLGLLTSLLIYLQCIIVGVLMGQLQSLEYNLREMDLEYYGKKLTMDKRAADTFLIRRLSEIISQHQNCNELYETSKKIVSHVLLIVLSCCSFSFVLCATWV